MKKPLDTLYTRGYVPRNAEKWLKLSDFGQKPVFTGFFLWVDGLQRHFSDLQKVSTKLQRHFSVLKNLSTKLQRHFSVLKKVSTKLQRHFSDLKKLSAKLQKVYARLQKVRAGVFWL